jgi:hypothetical protein
MLTGYSNRQRRARCRHPKRAAQFQLGGAGAPDRLRCGQCGALLLALEPKPPRPRDKPWRPRPV